MRSLLGSFLPLFCVVYLETSNGLMPAAGQLMMQSRLIIVPGVENAVQIIGVNLCSLVLMPRGSIVREGNTLKHSTSSHKWWEILKGSMFVVMPSIPALRRPGGGVVVASDEKASFQESQFDSKQCRDQFVTPLSCL